MSLKSHSDARNFFFDGFKNELRHLCPLNRIQIFEQIHCNTLKMKPLDVLKLIVGNNLWIELILKILNYSAHMHKSSFSGLRSIKVTFK